MLEAGNPKDDGHG